MWGTGSPRWREADGGEESDARFRLKEGLLSSHSQPMPGATPQRRAPQNGRGRVAQRLGFSSVGVEDVRAEASEALYPHGTRMDVRRSCIHHRRALRAAHGGPPHQLGHLPRIFVDLRLEVALGLLRHRHRRLGHLLRLGPPICRPGVCCWGTRSGCVAGSSSADPCAWSVWLGRSPTCSDSARSASLATRSSSASPASRSAERSTPRSAG
jgi:hypothetical protein